MKLPLRIALWPVLAILAWTAPASGAGIHAHTAWEQIPVLDSGRVMPMDSYARHLLLGFSGKSTFNRQPASHWLARVLFTPDDTRDDAIFLVNHPEVVEALGLSAEGRDRYSFNQLEPALAELTRLARAAFHLDRNERDPVQTELMSLYNSLNTYSRLTRGFDFALPQPELDVRDPELRHDLGLPDGEPTSLLDLLARRGQLDKLQQELRAAGTTRTPYAQELARVNMALRMRTQQGQDLPPAILPLPAHEGGDWIGPWAALGMHAGDQELQRLVTRVAEMARAYRAGEQAAFDIAAHALSEGIASQLPAANTLGKLRHEITYNKADAFYRSEMLYGFAFLAALISVASRRKWLYRLAAALVVLALIPHTYGIVARMVIMDRPPVTNLYSTFVFVSWTCALIGLAVEYFQRNRLGLITASSMGLALLLTSGRFGSDGDTMGVMVAVLDSNFWLATHVVTISIGYAGCVAAGLLGHIYLLQALRRAPDDAGLKETYQAVYGSLAFGLIFSFLGTMLGGVWADQSWGRFWGWDPKENGALVIVLWSAIIFHAKLDRLVGPLGFAAGCVLGVIWVLLAWLGVNLLNVGLHSYGFTSGIARGLAIACGLELLFVLAITPLAHLRARKTKS